MKLGPYIIPLTEVNGLKTNAKLATPRRTYRSKAPWHGSGNKIKSKQVGLHQTKKLLHSKRNHK